MRDISPKECKGIKAQCHISCQVTVLALRPNNCRKLIYLRGPVLDAGGKPVEASIDWKSNAHTALGPAIDPGYSVVQSRRNTATLTCCPIRALKVNTT